MRDEWQQRSRQRRAVGSVVGTSTQQPLWLRRAIGNNDARLVYGRHHFVDFRGANTYQTASEEVSSEEEKGEDTEEGMPEETWYVIDDDDLTDGDASPRGTRDLRGRRGVNDVQGAH